MKKLMKPVNILIIGVFLWLLITSKIFSWGDVDATVSLALPLFIIVTLSVTKAIIDLLKLD